MRYTVTTFKVRLEVCDVGERTGASDDVVRVARPIFADLDADKEHFLLLALNNKNRINGAKVISTGTLTATLIRPADVYAALDLRAAAVVFVHNHPSGDPMPSPEDQEITRRLKECGEMLPTIDFPGINEVERIENYPDMGSDNFPARNVMFLVNSQVGQVQQGSYQSTQSMQVTETDMTRLMEFIKSVEDALTDAGVFVTKPIAT